MKRSFILLTCVLAFFASCNKGEVVTEAVDENANVQALTIDATLTPATGEGMRASFAADDILRVKFVNSAGDQVGRVQVLRGTDISGTSASFTSDKVAVPNDAADMVVYLDNSITNGVDSTHFGPDRGCTRGQVVTFQWRSAGMPEPASGTNPFIDVKSDAYYHKAVLWAVEQGITKGTSADKFSPDSTCTRGQIVTFLYRDLAE